MQGPVIIWSYRSVVCLGLHRAIQVRYQWVRLREQTSQGSVTLVTSCWYLLTHIGLHLGNEHADYVHACIISWTFDMDLFRSYLAVREPYLGLQFDVRVFLCKLNTMNTIPYVPQCFILTMWPNTYGYTCTHTLTKWPVWIYIHV